MNEQRALYFKYTQKLLSEEGTYLFVFCINDAYQWWTDAWKIIIGELCG